MKICSACNKELELSNFSDDKRGKQGKASRCKHCEKHRKLEWSRNNKEWKRNHYFITKYSISSKDYDKMFEEQSGKCAICFQTPEETHRKMLYVDHNHITGKVRGLLCHHCNTSLGLAKDSIATLTKMIDYLKEHNEY